MKSLTSIFPWLFSTFLALGGWGIGYAQTNLVPNPSFEQYSLCPSNVGEIFQAAGWSSYSNSPDYFHFCGNPCVSTPDNCFGSQVPASGNAYIGFYGGGPGDNYREYAGIQLTSPLTISQKYFVSFKVSRSNDVGVWTSSTNKQSVLFSTIPYSSSSPAPCNNFAHIYNDSVITDSLSWTLFLASFISDSAYQFLSVGNFYDDSSTNFIGNQYSYYYLDDICVSTDSMYAATWTGVITHQSDPTVNIFPNPFNQLLTIHATVPYNLEIFNALGQQLYIEIGIEDLIREFNFSSFPSGVVYIRIRYSDKTICYKSLKF